MRAFDGYFGRAMGRGPYRHHPEMALPGYEASSMLRVTVEKSVVIISVAATLYTRISHQGYIYHTASLTPLPNASPTHTPNAQTQQNQITHAP